MWQVRRHGRALYVFYRLPGAFPKKLTDLFNLGTLLMGLYNKKGIFGNVEDPEEGLREALAACFEEYEVRVVGVVALFEARKPKTVES